MVIIFKINLLTQYGYITDFCDSFAHLGYAIIEWFNIMLRLYFSSLVHFAVMIDIIKHGSLFLHGYYI